MTKEEIIKMAKQAGFERLGHDDYDYVCYPDDIEHFAKLVAEHEREACAVVAEESFCGCGRSSCIDGDLRAHNIATSIRSRGDKND